MEKQWKPKRASKTAWNGAKKAYANPKSPPRSPSSAAREFEEDSKDSRVPQDGPETAPRQLEDGVQCQRKRFFERMSFNLSSLQKA